MSILLSTKDHHHHPSNLESNPPPIISSIAMKAGDHDESFEFFSAEWLKNNKDSNFFPPHEEDILFCGNFIFSKQPPAVSKDTTTQDNTKLVDMKKSAAGRSSSSWDRQYAKLMSMNKGRNNHGGQLSETNRVFPASASASMKSRWYYHGFNLLAGGVPAEMDLGTMRNRQMNRHRKTHTAVVGGEKMDGAGEKGLSRLIRELSCDGQTQANSMVKASLVCIPRV